MPDFYIRADANGQIGTGHVMRCLSIAGALRKKNYNCIFIMADDAGSALPENAGCEVICLHTLWNRMDTETEKLKALIRDRKIERLLVDSYFVTKSYLEEIGCLCRVFYIDDCDMFVYPADTVINYSIYADKFDYEKRYREVGRNTRFVLGCSYAPLREQFYHVDYVVRESVSDILITTGGTDEYNAAGRIAESILAQEELAGVRLHIVIGAYYTNKKYLEKLAEENEDIILHRNVTQMAELMTSCDVAVTAGGTTLYELCACQVPTVAVSLADNQLDNVRRFADDGLIVYAGDVRGEAIKAVCGRITETLRQMRNDRNVRERLSACMKLRNIGGGSERLAEILTAE